jgi:hypothetical protein
VEVVVPIAGAGGGITAVGKDTVLHEFVAVLFEGLVIIVITMHDKLNLRWLPQSGALNHGQCNTVVVRGILLLGFIRAVR